MNWTPEQKLHLIRLIEEVYEDGVSREKLAELDMFLKNNHHARATYLEYTFLHSGLQRMLKLSDFPAESKMPDEADQSLFNKALAELGEEEVTAPAIQIMPAAELPERDIIRKVQKEPVVRQINKTSLTVAILSMAALFIMIAYVYLSGPAPYAVATVTDSIDAEWTSGLPLADGIQITTNSKPIQLTHGVVKLITEENVELVLEAPTEFKFVSYSEIALGYGKLFARVSEMGSGFSVATPNSRIVDLGTEFGVLSGIDGNTQVFMYKGKANIFAGEKRQRKTSQLLTAGNAVKIESHEADIREIALDEQAIIRNIDSDAKLIWRGQHVLRLGDLLLGGDGFGTAPQRRVEYDPETGDAVAAADAVLKYRKGPGKLVAIKDSPYLDSIFVPGSGDAAIPISTEGHPFRDCPQTSGLYYANACFYRDWTFFDSLQQTFEASHQQFSDSGMLYLHSDLGLTVDLNAIRRAAPGLQIASFSAFAGIIRLGDTSVEESKYAEADVWVLVDGQVRSSRLALRADEGYAIDVPLSDRDRFLTLVVTDGGKEYSTKNPANYYDTCGFAEPVFTVSSR